MSEADYLSLGIDPDDAAVLDHAATRGVPGNLVIVHSADPGLAYSAATLAAAAKLTGPHAQLDVHLAVPSGDRWTVAEVDERVLRPARLKAFERSHVVVADADQMAQAAHDHVLKTVEEPTSGAQFWFTVTDPDRLPVTLRGRSAATFAARPAPLAHRVQLLEQAGADAEHAAAVADLAGDDVRLALAVAAAPHLLPDLQRYRTQPLTSATPTQDADAALATLLRLAAALPTPTPTGADEPQPKRRRAATAKAAAPARGSLRPRWDSIPQQARADARRLLRRLLDRWAADLVGQVRSAATAPQLQAADAALRAVDRAHRELATNAAAATVLPALLARVNP